MNILIVYAHPDPLSFAGAMRDRALDVLRDRGHVIQVSDLYEMRFKADMDAGDFTDPRDESRFDIQLEQLHAYETSTFAADITAEQQKLLWAQIVLFIFPLWWYSVPAILKGWIDRVLTYGFAYGPRNLRGRRAMLMLTTGGPAQLFTPEKRVVMSDMLEPIQRGTLAFCGFDVLPLFAAYGADNAIPEQREQYLLQFTQVLLSLTRAAPLSFR